MESVEPTPHAHPARPIWLTNLAMYQPTRFKRLGISEVLGKAIRMSEEAVAATPSTDDLEKTIRISEEAMEATVPYHPHREY